MIFLRHAHPNDYDKQIAEYEKLYGSDQEVTFFVITDYAHEDMPYEDFIAQQRQATGIMSHFMWW